MKAIPSPKHADSSFVLTVEQTMKSSPERLFKGWVKELDQWFAEPGTVLMEGRENTPYFFYTYFEGSRHAHYGRFIEVKEEKLIVMTWVTGDPGTNGKETVLTLEFEPHGSGTKLRLHHAGFPTKEIKDGHAEAWPGALQLLDNY